MTPRFRDFPKGLLLVLFGLVFGMVWTVGSSPGTPVQAQSSGVTSLTAGAGLSASPNPVTSTGTISVAFGGNGSATTVSRSNHHHDSRYLRLTGGILSGDLAFAGNRQILAPRIENASAPPAGAAAGRLWFDTLDLRLKVHDGTSWLQVPQFHSDQNLALRILGVPSVPEDLACAVTLNLPAEELVLVDCGAVGQLSNLINYDAQAGIPTQNQIRLTLSVAVDAGTPSELVAWELTTRALGTLPAQRKNATSIAFRLAAGSHTLRLFASRSGTVLPFSSTLPPEACEARISEAWLRVHRP
jgi:hypothetical protein